MDEFEVRQQLVSSSLSAGQASLKAGLFIEATNALREMRTSIDAVHYYFVPGRIEFLGKHTDYGGGRSLICALERGFCVAASARDDSRVRITDAARNDRVEFSISPELIPRTGHWSNYPITVATRVAQNFRGPLRGADIAFVSDLPPAAGLSSSSALIIAVFASLARINALDQCDEYKSNIHSVEDLAGYLGSVENGQTFGSLAGSKGVGTLGGSQDHTAILCCRRGELSQYSFCPVRQERSIALPAEHVFVIGVSGVLADKTGEALEKYNRVSSLAAEVLEVWRRATGMTSETLMAAATSSTDAPKRMREALISSRSPAFSPRELLNRFEQFLNECTEIIPGVAQSLAAGELDKIGALVDRSQDGAERLLGNQVPETIALTRIARELGAVAASAFGAGFGGSVWAMVRTDRADSLTFEWAELYRSRFPESAKRSTFFSTCAGPSMIEFGSGL
ncbi:MAG TPA: galactokinase family protein [Blastocatellia bacterium]|nr:galactokinase family protein [Blastocatellia bacterium]